MKLPLERTRLRTERILRLSLYLLPYPLVTCLVFCVSRYSPRCSVSQRFLLDVPEMWGKADVPHMPASIRDRSQHEPGVYLEHRVPAWINEIRRCLQHRLDSVSILYQV